MDGCSPRKIQRLSASASVFGQGERLNCRVKQGKNEIRFACQSRDVEVDTRARLSDATTSGDFPLRSIL